MTRDVTPLALLAPPSHPTTLGDVWIGDTRADPRDLARALEVERQRREHRRTPGVCVVICATCSDPDCEGTHRQVTL